MRILAMIDSFKGSLSSPEAGEASLAGARRVYPDAEVRMLPLADGGEGTVEALVAGCGGTLITTRVKNPLGEETEAHYGIIRGDTAIVEASAAAGITLLKAEERNPLKTTTYGVGQIIRDAIAKGCRRFIVGIGGSATNDGGMGMLRALGFGFYDKEGKDIPLGAEGLRTLARLTADGAMPELADCEFRIACDVTNPLCGEQGCSAIYGPQKGATPEMVRMMDAWLGDYAALAKTVFPNADPDRAGAGAAGGLGFAFATFLGGELRSGISLVLDEIGAEDDVRWADIVLTGEGRLDAQSAMGKAPVGVARLAKKHGKTVIALAGCIGDGAVACHREGIDAFFPVLQGVSTLAEAMDKATATRNLERTTEQVFRLIKSQRG